MSETPQLNIWAMNRAKLVIQPTVFRIVEAPMVSIGPRIIAIDRPDSLLTIQYD
jgi:hypothetical protein